MLPEKTEEIHNPDKDDALDSPDTACAGTKSGRLMTFLFSIAIISALLLFVFSPARTFSEPENRLLAQRPEFGADAVLSGSWQRDWENYLSDQFPARDTITAAATVVRKLSGQNDIGGVWLSKDGFYPEIHTDYGFDEDGFLTNIGYINSFSEKFPDIPCTVLLVPDAACVLSEKLPPFATAYDAGTVHRLAKESLADCRVPDLLTVFEESNDQSPYFRTDHHWSASGVSLAYQALTDGQGNYKDEPVLFSDAFLGSTYSKTMDPAAKPEELYIFPVSEGITVAADGEEVPLYDLTAAEKKDKYSVFLGGNYGLVTIKSNAGTGRSLMIIKDSFANSLVPLLTADYDVITMIDLRYFGGSPAGLTTMTAPDELLFVYSNSNLEQGSELVKLLLP